eukprot:Phypoly_transcript_19274.p1 GENE.Phypoly_transcript_19274~~Phypoly_transcript_19274.p1  ORF type:complete len:230 (+),score=20.27 Phypoly_transcript_19274:26-691(+)
MGLKNVYLVAYNFIQAIGWLYILVQVIQHAVKPNPNETLWDKVGLAVSIFQNAAILEIFHSMFGIVKAPMFTTLVQVFSRVALVFITNNVPDVEKHWILTVMLLSWSLTEVVRYTFYGANLLGNVPFIIGWLRYTLFIILYPTGVSGEIGSILVSLPYVRATKIYSFEMPNKYNFAFSFYYALLASLPLYVLGLPMLYKYMLVQRKRFLNPQPPADKPKVQ